MERRRLKPVRLFSSDIDGTLAGDRAASRRFADFWDGLAPATRPLLVYNSGRLIDDILEYTEHEGLPKADIVIGGVGTMVAADGHPHLRDDYAASIEHGYDAGRIGSILEAMPGIERQPSRYQHERKSSWYFHDATDESLQDLEARLLQQDLSVKVVYSSRRDLDILPANADKGQALAWLCGKLDIALDEVVVAGDTGNDSGMFSVAGVRGVIPANGLDELKRRFHDGTTVYHAGKAEADGVIEGLRHWRVGMR